MNDQLWKITWGYGPQVTQFTKIVAAKSFDSAVTKARKLHKEFAEKTDHITRIEQIGDLEEPGR